MRLRPVFVPRTAPDSMWEALRAARNSCAQGLTHERGEITPQQQENYRRGYSENVRHYLYFDGSFALVGFSRLEYREDGFVYPTYGVIPGQQGRGYSWEVVQHAMLAAGGPLKGDLLAANKAIMKVDFTLGWRVTRDAGGGILEVQAPWPPRGVRLFDPKEFEELGSTGDLVEWGEARAFEHDRQQQDALDEIIRYHEEGPDQ